MKIEQIQNGHIQNLMIEITRDCNFSCSHCLRGEAQKIDLEVHELRKFLYDNNVSSIGSLTLSGGEPLSKPKILKDLAYDFRAMNIDIEYCYIATNGSYFNYETFFRLADIYNCFSEGLFLEVSNSSYHQSERKKLGINLLLDKEDIIYKIKEELLLSGEFELEENEDIEDNYHYGQKLEHIFCLFNEENFQISLDKRNYRELIEEGRGYKVGGYKEASELEDFIYYSAKNEIIINKCDLSYKSMRKSKLV